MAGCQRRGWVLVNPRYGLIGLAVGPAEPPARLAVRLGVQRIEKGGVVELPGEPGQPGWLLFRGEVEPVLSLADAAGRAD